MSHEISMHYLHVQCNSKICATKENKYDRNNINKNKMIYVKQICVNVSMLYDLLKLFFCSWDIGKDTK